MSSTNFHTLSIQSRQGASSRISNIFSQEEEEEEHPQPAQQAQATTAGPYFSRKRVKHTVELE
jgi:hypothetical protein